MQLTRSTHGIITRSACHASLAVQNCGPKIVAVIKMYRGQVLRVQKHMQNYMICGRARIALLERRWREVFYEFQTDLRRQSIVAIQVAKEAGNSVGAVTDDLEDKLVKLSKAVSEAQLLVQRHNLAKQEKNNGAPEFPQAMGTGSQKGGYRKTNECNKYVLPAIRKQILRNFLRRERKEYRIFSQQYLREKAAVPSFDPADALRFLDGHQVRFIIELELCTRHPIDRQCMDLYPFRDPFTRVFSLVWFVCSSA